MNHIEIHQTDLIDILCDEPNWESHGLDPKKNLLLYGPTGVGKTYALEKYLRDTFKNVGHRIDAETIEMGIQSRGPDYFQRFYTDNMLWNDLGQEERIFMYMGTQYKPAHSIITMRYERFPILKTHITTNKTPEKLEEKYGDRVVSRLIEICNFINVTGEDLRK